LSQHVARGKITEEAASEAGLFEVFGGTTSREVAEQTTINWQGGIENLANEVNPVGAGRQYLMSDPTLGVISKSNQVNWAGVMAADFGIDSTVAATGGYGGLFPGNSAAEGGFLIYPNKPNNNMMRSVYSK
jgi:hypothetical protein